MDAAERRGVFLAAASIVLLTAIRASAGEDLVGAKVIAIRPAVVVRQKPADDAPLIDYTTPAPIWTIDETKAGWLQGKDGWVRRADVVPLGQAVEFFTAEIDKSPTAYAYAARARARLEKDQTDEAAKDVETALSMAPDSCDALFAKASLLQKNGRTEEEADCYRRIIKLDPRCQRIYGALLLILMKKRELDGVLDVASAALRQWPEESLFRDLRAGMYLIRGSERSRGEDYVGAEQDYGNAIDDWNELLKQLPAAEPKKKCAQVYGYRAALRIQAGRIDEAITDFDRSLELIPDAPQIWFQCGVLRGGNNEHRAAIEDFKKAIQLGLKNALVYAAYGHSLLSLDLVDDAILNLDESIRLDDRNPAIYELRGSAWLRKAEYARAIADFDKAIALGPPQATYFERRAEAWHELKEEDKAIDDCTSALKLNPQSTNALTNRAVSYANQQKFERAIADCDSALKLDAKNSVAYRERGSIKATQGDYRQAIEDLTKAISLDPLDSNAFWNRGSAWGLLGEYEHAVADLNEFLRLSPQSSAGYRTRAEIYKAAGNLQQAAEDEQTAERIEAESRRR